MSHIQTVSKDSSVAVVDDTLALTGVVAGNALICSARANLNAIVTVTDDVDGAWAHVTGSPVNFGTSHSLNVLYKLNHTGGNVNVTIDDTAQDSRYRWAVSEYSSITGINAQDDSQDETTSLTSTDTSTVYAVSTQTSNSNSATQDTGYTLRAAAVGGRLSTADKVTSSAGAESHTWTNVSTGPSMLVALTESTGPDTTPPGFTSGPSVTNTTLSGHTLSATLNETGTVYAIRMTNGATAPVDGDDVITKHNAGVAGDVLEVKSSASTASNNVDLVFSTGASGIAYDYYYVAEDDESTPNVQAAATLIEASTTSFEITGPASITQGVEATLTGTNLDTITSLNIIGGGSTEPQSITTQPGTTLTFTPDSGLDDAVTGSGTQGVPFTPTITAAGITPYQIQIEASDGTDTVTHTVTFNPPATHDTIQTTAAAADTTDGISLFGSVVLAVEDDHQVTVPKSQSGVTITWANDGTFTATPDQDATLDATYFTPSTDQLQNVAFTIDASGLDQPATGTPTLTTPGAAQVGAVFTPGYDDVDDPDGITNIAASTTWTYQRIPVAGGAAVDITTGATYTAQTADIDHTLRVRLNALDDLGNPIVLFSEDTATITAVDATKPTFLSATVPTAGDQVIINLSEGVQFGTDGNDDFTISLSGVTLTYASGANPLIYTPSRTILAADGAFTLDYTQQGDGVKDLAGNTMDSFSGQTVTNNSTQVGSATATATIATANEFPVNKNVFGVHGEMVYGSGYRIEDTEISTLINALGITFIRIPGGNQANYWLSQVGVFGTNNPEVPDAAAQANIDNYNNAIVTLGEYTVANMITMLQATGIEFSVVANVLGDTPVNTRKFMEQLDAASLTPAYVEMGNELEFSTYAYAFPANYRYSTISAKHAHEVLQVFPGMEIVNLASNSTFKAANYPDINSLQGLANQRSHIEFDYLAASSPAADSIALHFYADSGQSDTSQSQAVFNSVGYDAMQSHIDARLSATVDRFAAIAPGKDLHITEYGTEFGTWRAAYREGYLETVYYSLMCANILLQMFTKSSIKSGVFHSVRHFWENSNIADTSPAHALFGLLDGVVDNAANISDVTLTGIADHTSTHSDYPGTAPEVYAVMFRGATNSWLVVLNKYGTSYDLTSIVDDTGTPAVTLSSMTALTCGGDPTSTAFTSTTTALTASETVTIAPYSVTKILMTGVG